MINVYILGINGKMGQALQETILQSQNFQLEKSISDPIDVIIDFSSPEGLKKGLSLALELDIPFISGTTDLGDEHFDMMNKAALSIPVLHAYNFSYGIYMIKNFLNIQPYLEEYFVDIFESHNLSKKDAPSGTTLDLVKLLNSKTVKSSQKEQREKDDLNIHIKRTPYFSCDHCIELSNEDEKIVIKHSSKSRQVYARGSLLSAEWLVNKEKGFYTAADVFNSAGLSCKKTQLSLV